MPFAAAGAARRTGPGVGVGGVAPGAPGGKKLLKMRRDSGHSASFKRASFKIKRPESGGSESLRD